MATQDDQQPDPAVDIAQRLWHLQSLVNGFSHWPLDDHGQPLKAASEALVTWRLLLSSGIAELIYALECYDGDIADALDQLDSD